MHLNLILSDCFSINYDLSAGGGPPASAGGRVRLRIPRDQFAPLIRRGVRCRMAVSPVQGRDGRVVSVRARNGTLTIDVKLRPPD